MRWDDGMRTNPAVLSIKTPFPVWISSSETPFFPRIHPCYLAELGSCTASSSRGVGGSQTLSETFARLFPFYIDLINANTSLKTWAPDQPTEVQSLVTRGALPTPSAAHIEGNPGKTCEGSFGFRGHKSKHRPRFAAAGQEWRALHHNWQNVLLSFALSSSREAVSGEQLDLPFFCINCALKGFNSQELNIFLHFKSTSPTEAVLGATLHCCPWLWGCQGGSRAGFALRQRDRELS